MSLTPRTGEINWTAGSDSSAWESHQYILDRTRELLMDVHDPRFVDLVEQFGIALVAHIEQIRTLRELLSAVLALSHAQGNEAIRLKARVVALIEQGQRQRQLQAQAQCKHRPNAECKKKES
jgi:hypothetical protein